MKKVAGLGLAPSLFFFFFWMGWSLRPAPGQIDELKN